MYLEGENFYSIREMYCF